MKNQVITIDITDLTPEGFGVGRHEGKVVFVSDSAVGDKLEVLILKELKNRSFAKPLNIITPSPDRIQSDCSVSKKCGGCAFRHISYESELKLKKNLVEQAFARIGGMKIKVNDTVFDSPESYRNKVQYPFAPNKNGGCTFGYYARHSHRIVEHDACPLQEGIFTEIARFVCQCADKFLIPAYNEETKKGVLRHIVLRKNREGDISVCLVVNKKSPFLLQLCEDIPKNFPRVKGVHVNLNKRPDNVIFGEETFPVVGEETLRDTLCGKTFELSPRSFYQVNAVMAEKLYLHGKSLISKRKKDGIILDLYCGVGTIGLSLAEEGDKLCGVEIIDAAVRNAKVNSKLNGRTTENTLFVCGDASLGVEKCREKFGNPETIIVDPPRKGLDREVIETVVSAKPKNILYISCDPATLARDCGIFAEKGYFTSEATPFDLFPRTGHVETVVLLEPTVSAR